MGPNPKLYRELSVPFETLAAADAAIQGFFAEFEALREKWKLQDVYAVVEVPVLDEGGEEGRVSAHAMYGDETKALPLVAYAYGLETARHTERTSRHAAEGRRRGEKQKPAG
jgi:hypothetical protein